MSNRDLILHAVEQLPDCASMEDIVETVRFVAGVQEAIEQSDRGEGVTLEEARQFLHQRTIERRSKCI